MTAAPPRLQRGSSKGITERGAKSAHYCSDYEDDILKHLLSVETQVNPSYMSRQLEIHDKMRAILVDWLIEVHQKF